MITWSIEAAERSKCFDRIIVSTDDEEIAELARSCGAEVPFMRSPTLSDDRTTSVAVIADTALRIVEAGETSEAICCLYATAPFVRPEDIKAALDILERTNAPFVFPVTTFDFPIDRALVREPHGGVKMRHPEHLLTRHRDLTEYFHDAGQLY
jgi:CMP-N-acetylneuraminic acid synthetase